MPSDKLFHDVTRWSLNMNHIASQQHYTSIYRLPWPAVQLVNILEQPEHRDDWEKSNVLSIGFAHGPQNTMELIKNKLASDGTVMMQIPMLEPLLREGNFYLCSEYCTYEGLKTLFRRYGLTITNVQEDGPFYCVTASNIAQDHVSFYEMVMDRNPEKFFKRIERSRKLLKLMLQDQDYTNKAIMILGKGLAQDIFMDTWEIREQIKTEYQRNECLSTIDVMIVPNVIDRELIEIHFEDWPVKIIYATPTIEVK